MARLGIETGADLASKDIEFLRANFGSIGDYLFGAARGIDHRRVRADRIRKSIGAERTFHENISDPAELREICETIAGTVWERIETSRARGRTVTLKLRYADFNTLTRAHSVRNWIADKQEFCALGQSLLDDLMPLPQPVRLMGLTLSNLQSDEEKAEATDDAQLSLL